MGNHSANGLWDQSYRVGLDIAFCVTPEISWSVKEDSFANDNKKKDP